MQAPCTRTRPCDRAFAALRRIAHCALATQTAAPRTMSEAAKKKLARKAEEKQKRRQRALEKEDARAAYREKLKRPKHDLEPSSDEDEGEDDDDDSHSTDN